jgi:hypothetical protein|tara:strand:- start:15 stop:188 length:174 start_codon:yes stop_codon:yes gene_type:complete
MINTVEKNYINNKFENYKMTLINNEVYFVPLDEANTDYQAIQEWISLGNTVIDNPPE